MTIEESIRNAKFFTCAGKDRLTVFGWQDAVGPKETETLDALRKRFDEAISEQSKYDATASDKVAPIIGVCFRAFRKLDKGCQLLEVSAPLTYASYPTELGGNTKASRLTSKDFDDLLESFERWCMYKYDEEENVSFEVLPITTLPTHYAQERQNDHPILKTMASSKSMLNKDDARCLMTGFRLGLKADIVIDDAGRISEFTPKEASFSDAMTSIPTTDGQTLRVPQYMKTEMDGCSIEDVSLYAQVQPLRRKPANFMTS